MFTEPNSLHTDLDGWQAALRDALRTLDELAAELELAPDELDAFTPERRDFSLLVPRGFVRRMRKRDPADPLLMQVLPRRAEQTNAPGYRLDPLEEVQRAQGGMLEKYAGRALLIAAEACPVHCRYCFRRNFPYADHLASRNDWQDTFARLARRPDLDEIILSGGDPLSLTNRRLQALLLQLEQLESVTTLRIHTRFPIMLPERIDADLLALLRASRLKCVVVVHCNHANELDQSVATALERLAGAGCLLLNQSVLLRAVNDSADALESLSRELFAQGVLPYYLHQLDRVAGAAHFEVTDTAAHSLIADLRRRLPGYLVPRLVREVPGELSKTSLA
jgi:EF-P beta-lysylation protein EpmB